MRYVFSLVLCAGSLCAASAFAQDAKAPATTPVPAAASPAENKPADAKPVDLVICLDTSGSMDGLIDAARQKIWGIVNDLATAKPRPVLRVALLSYGNDGYASEDGWVRTLLPFTTDLDEVSKQLFALSTNGGTELVGRVVNKAVGTLDWTTDKGAMKLIVVAGNEGADQDHKVTYQDACTAAIGKGIMINAIYCGDSNDNLAAAWREVSKLTDGEFAAIDQNKNEVIPTPHDSELADLSARLNSTYIAFGSRGGAGASKQAEQDMNAQAVAPGVAASRAATKAGRAYDNSTWDLVDATRAGDENSRIALESVKEEALPENMRKMTPKERAEYVDAKLRERDEIRRKIAESTLKRDAYLEAERKKVAEAGGAKDFESALRESVRKQAEKKGFRWEK